MKKIRLMSLLAFLCSSSTIIKAADQSSSISKFWNACSKGWNISTGTFSYGAALWTVKKLTPTALNIVSDRPHLDKQATTAVCGVAGLYVGYHMTKALCRFPAVDPNLDDYSHINPTHSGSVIVNIANLFRGKVLFPLKIILALYAANECIYRHGFPETGSECVLGGLGIGALYAGYLQYERHKLIKKGIPKKQAKHFYEGQSSDPLRVFIQIPIKTHYQNL